MIGSVAMRNDIVNISNINRTNATVKNIPSKSVNFNQSAYTNDTVDKKTLLNGTIPANAISFGAPQREKPISVYFSNVYSGNISLAQNDSNNPDRQLASFIDTAKSTLDLAVFELDSQIITDSILRAYERGVKVRVVTDDTHRQEDSIKRLEASGIPVIDDESKPLMHNKFVVLDNKAVWTGSFNTTDNCSWKNNNNAVKIYSDKLAENYTKEFNEMFVNKQFGRRSPNDTPNPVLEVGGTKIQNYFAAEGDVAKKVAEEIQKAKKSVHFMAFSFTEDGIGQAVIDKFNQGVEVKGVFEKVGSGTQYSEYPKMKEKGIDVKQDGNKYSMHHKVFIIDDTKVITGSYNFSNSADSENDENIVILENAELAKAYEEEFKRIYAQGN